MEYQYTASGGTPPYTFSIVAGALPTGLNMDSNGLVTGERIESGVFHWTVLVVDSVGHQCTLEDSAYVMDLAGDPPDGKVGVAYSYAMNGVSGVAPYTYALTAGSLPAGLSLSSGGIISGTPTTVETAAFSMAVTDSNGVVKENTYDIAITEPDTDLIVPGYDSATGYLVSVTGGSNPACSIEFIIYSNGTYIVRRFVGASTHTFSTGNWLTTPGPGVGADYEVRFVGTKKTIGDVTGTVSTPVNTGWMSLASDRGDSCAADTTVNSTMSQEIDYVITMRNTSDLVEVDSHMKITAEAST